MKIVANNNNLPTLIIMSTYKSKYGGSYLGNFGIYLNIIKIEATIDIKREIVSNGLKTLIYENSEKIHTITTLLLYNIIDMICSMLQPLQMMIFFKR